MSTDELETVIQVEGEHKGILTWDRVIMTLSDVAKARGLGAALGDRVLVAAIRISVEAGDIAYMDIECYGKAEDVLDEIRAQPNPDDMKCLKVSPILGRNCDMYTIRAPLLSLSVKSWWPEREEDCMKKYWDSRKEASRG